MAKEVMDLTDLSADERRELFGPQDSYLKIIQDVFKQSIYLTEDFLIINNDEVDVNPINNTLQDILNLIRKKQSFTNVDVQKIAESYADGSNEGNHNLYDKPLGRSFEHKLIYPKTANQKILVATLESKDMTFAIGPAGTGKTFLSVVYAISCLRADMVKKIIITRPVVEAGESLGFLPGDLEEKIDPYLRPIYDSLDYLLSAPGRIHLMEKGVIEIAPLAYMRGRTLDDAIIILDEAQNTTKMQMKMFLTRMGFNSKMIITGDITQIDLAKGKESGLNDAFERLKGISEIGFVTLDNRDVVRHALVKTILERYQ